MTHGDYESPQDRGKVIQRPFHISCGSQHISAAIVAGLAIPSIAFSGPPDSYYVSAIGKTADALKSALHTIIDGHTVLNYTDPNNDDWHDGEKIDVWEALVYTDSACPDSKPKCGLVQMLYLDEVRGIDKANRGAGKNDMWEREHVWPKSRGFNREAQDGYTDLHNIRPADRNLNRGHWIYGYDEGGKPLLDKLADNSERDVGAFLDVANESFEPPDRAKGQVARMIFYMAVRYEAGDDGPDEDMPDLTIRNENGRTKDPWIGDLCTLLKWNNKYGPTDFERRRNDRVYELQHNRNPFVDKPDFANLIWGHKCS